GGVPNSATMNAGSTGATSGGGGGGAGGAGRVTIRSRNPPPQSTAPGVVPMSAYVPLTLP
ncbi:MAG TPA: hypothetical protein VF997_09860, partial [Polyangia bacterium]